MGNDSFPHENIIKDTFIEQDLPFIGLHGGQPSPEVVTIHDLTELGGDPLVSGNILYNKFMNTGDTQPCPAGVSIAVIITYMIKIVAVIKYGDPRKRISPFLIHKTDPFKFIDTNIDSPKTILFY